MGESVSCDNPSYVNQAFLHSAITGNIIAAAQHVLRELGPGFEERIYQRALALELYSLNLEFDREVWIDVYYRSRKVRRKRVDFIIEEVMVEIKAKSEIEKVDIIQTLSYLKAAGVEIGLLLNFGSSVLGIKRLINTPKSTMKNNE
jgi:GxxExxY protein